MTEHETWLGTPAQRLLVQAAGWHLDEDDWWTRPARRWDAHAVSMVDPDSTQAFTIPEGTYCRTAAQVLAIDEVST